ncbi:hypothetical protein KR093_002389 [Drosophila rubida]|uniref:trypsin n=1 Tax=Drosophila rubida TaxID=30044 RepID=A0AAD4KC46_9MUSC|nr:hypothetical protein KR093_002389 [Drosophila rubida]
MSRLTTLLLLLVAPSLSLSLSLSLGGATSRLLDGEAAAVGSHPYSVSVQFQDAHVCGGALLSAQHCVTAAHCVTRGNGIVSYPARSFAVRAGSIQRSAGGQLVPVGSIVVHKEYADGLNDLALLVLHSPLTLNANTQPIALASEAPPVGAALSYSGWGSVGKSGDFSHRLLVGSQLVISAADCQQQIFIQHAGLLCLASASTSEAEQRMCAGDGGAPAVYKNELVAIGSFYVGGCGTSKPDGFVNIAHYRDWISENSP